MKVPFWLCFHLILNLSLHCLSLARLDPLNWLHQSLLRDRCFSFVSNECPKVFPYFILGHSCCRSFLNSIQNEKFQFFIHFQQIFPSHSLKEFESNLLVGFICKVSRSPRFVHPSRDNAFYASLDNRETWGTRFELFFSEAWL